MAIATPVAGTGLSVSTFGKPVVDEINRMTPLVVAAPSWTNLTLQNSWTNAGGTRPPSSFRKMGDLVYIRIAATGGGNGTVVTTLPAGNRPQYTWDFMGRDSSVWNVNADGTVVFYGAVTTSAYFSCVVATS